MRKHFQKVVFVFLMIGVFLPASFAQKKTGQPIDVVFCMDLSNSSNGLISQFRNHLWDYWYFFTHCQPQPDYRIAVVTYARFSYGKSSGYTRIVRDFGTDFEKLSALLFKIAPKIEKGDQHVGSALNVCLKQLSWSKDPAAKKIIFLVGNGDVTLGRDNIDVVTDRLVQNNIVVNSIYCTVPGERKAIIGWEKIALKTGGKISSMSIRTMYFDRLNGFDMKTFRALNRKFNNTYLFYGNGGRLKWKTLVDEDNHIFVTNTEGYRYRSLYKISDDYQKKNYSWDLVDLYYKNPVGFMNVERKFLNDTCKKMNKDQMKAYIIYKKYERRKLSTLISDMITEKDIKDKSDGSVVEKKSPTLDIISLKSIREILNETGVTCPLN